MSRPKWKSSAELARLLEAGMPEEKLANLPATKRQKLEQYLNNGASKIEAAKAKKARRAARRREA